MKHTIRVHEYVTKVYEVEVEVDSEEEARDIEDEMAENKNGCIHAAEAAACYCPGKEVRIKLLEELSSPCEIV
ncbi:MAG: hypothetical protein Q4A78_11970 [Peptostreptococcaceae bacterium]|nr:hypothetical protein [Peptostreptococcaceae bacterium]